MKNLNFTPNNRALTCVWLRTTHPTRPLRAVWLVDADPNNARHDSLAAEFRDGGAAQ